MNLARQIAKDLEDAGCLMLVTSASIIAAKLESVRGEICNLKNIADESNWDFDSGDRGVALIGINRLLDLLEEEK